MKTVRILFLYALAALFALACTPEVDLLKDTFLSSQADLSGSGQNLQILFDANAGTATIDLKASKKWEAKFVNDRASWCRLSTDNGKRGTATLTITVTANDSYEERSASIAFTCDDARQTLVVVQKQNDAVLLSSAKLEVPEAGGEFSLEVRHNIDYSVALDDAAKDWVRVLSTKGLQTNTVRLQVEPNESFSTRTGTLTVKSSIGSETVTIYQAAATPTLVLTQREFTLSDDGGTVTVEIRSNVDFTSEITEGADWITALKTKSMSTHTLRFNVAHNTTYDNRSGAIRIADKEHGLSETVTIQQKQKDALLLTWNEFDLSDEGKVITVEVKSNVDFDFEIPEGADWISPVSTRGLTTHTLDFVVARNETYDSRKGTIRFTDKARALVENVTVRQKQKDAMFLVQDRYVVSEEGELITVEVQSNVDFSYEITAGGDWIKYTKTKGLFSNKLNFVIAKNPGGFERVGTIVFRDAVTGHEQPVTITQEESSVEKKILMAIYDACTSESCRNAYYWAGWSLNNPLRNWSLVTLNEEGRVEALELCDFQGTLPDAIGGLTELKSISTSYGSKLSTFPAGLCKCTKLEEIVMTGSYQTPCFEGMLPAAFGNLKQLRVARFQYNAFTSFPTVLFKCTKLEELDLRYGKMSGLLPEGFGALPNLTYLLLNYNFDLTGPVPRSMINLPCWKYYAMDIVDGTNLTIKASDFVAPEFDLPDLDGNRIVTSDLYRENTYTIFLTCYCDDYYKQYLDQLAQLETDLPTSVGIVILFGNSESEADVRAFRDKHSIPWPCLIIKPDMTISDHTGYVNLYAHSMQYRYVSFVVDGQGKMIGCCGGSTPGFEDNALHFLNRAYGRQYGYYASSDYSHDGEVTVLQQATEGQGIDLVFVGEGYSDRLIADGTYLADMRAGMEAVFHYEPYKSFRQLFNVYAVTAVSKNDQFDPAYGTETIFGVNLSGANGLSCNKLYMVSEYALKAFGGDENRLNHTGITTIIHATSGRSVCYMGDPINGSRSMAFCVNMSASYLEYVVGHEMGGHGFGGLGDEYVDAGVAAGRSLDAFRYDIAGMHERWYYMNLDAIKDPAAIAWSKFLSLPDYATSVGVYEGGYYFPSGVYRPSENSIMRGNGGFNAPSREAIYYKIHKMAYGDSWNYDFADFLRYDKINLANPAPGPWKQSDETPIDIRELTAPPILNWQ
ncbi:MAG: hypothetical protein J5702_01405 [Bacteroidales bacterium]|nr:hypothetical protein [Bacteroidales bacterium]